MSYHKKSLSRKIIRAVHEYRMIEPGDRVLVALSGGKDSLTLLLQLQALKKALGFDYHLEAIHIQSDFCNCAKKSALEVRMAELGVPFHEVFVPIIGRLKPGRKMNCYWCSMQRRGALMDFALKHDFKRIALGHHMDDIIETLLMNSMYHGRLEAMPPHLRYDRYPLSIIRPLMYVEEAEIIAYTQAEGVYRLSCQCPYGKESQRKKIREKVALLTGGDPALKRNIMDSMKRVNTDYLL